MRALLARWHRVLFVASLPALAMLPAFASATATRTNDEIGALATAETFGYAWATRDAKLGAATIASGRSDRHPGRGAIRAFFVGVSSPHHAAFAIERMRPTAGGYACTITLYEYLYAGHGRGGYTATTLTIELSKRGDAWKVVPGRYVSVAPAGG